MVHARAAWERAAPDANGLRRLVEHRAQGRVDDLRPFAQAFAALPKALMVAAIDDPPTLLVAASEDSGVDAGRLVKEAVSAAGWPWRRLPATGAGQPAGPGRAGGHPRVVRRRGACLTGDPRRPW